MSSTAPISDEVTAELAADAVDPLVGRTLLERFRLEEVVGRGAMGKVYRAVQVGLNRPVAVKVLDTGTGLGRDESFRQRFMVEAALTARLSHPNTVRVLDYGATDDGLLFLVMEYLSGSSLEEVLRGGAIAWQRAFTIGQQVARSLNEAHGLGVVHRDLKPANVMLLDTGDDAVHVKVLDFGLVKSFVEGQELEGRAITQQGMIVGSPQYMAPEQGERNRADPRSDVYSLGVVLFEAVTGRPPFKGTAPLQTLLKHVHEPVPPLMAPAHLEAVPPAAQAIITRCLAKSPMDRFQSMEELLFALSALVTAPPARVEEPVVTTQKVHAVKRAAPRPSAAVLVMAALAATLTGLVATLVLRQAMQSEPVAVVVEPAPAPEPAPVAAAVPPVTFAITSEPAGATVTRDGKVEGVTPLTLAVDGDAAGATATLTLSREGFVPVTVTASGQGPRVELHQALQPVPPAPPRRAW